MGWVEREASLVCVCQFWARWAAASCVLGWGWGGERERGSSGWVEGVCTVACVRHFFLNWWNGSCDRFDMRLLYISWRPTRQSGLDHDREQIEQMHSNYTMVHLLLLHPIVSLLGKGKTQGICVGFHWFRGAETGGAGCVSIQERNAENKQG